MSILQRIRPAALLVSSRSIILVSAAALCSVAAPTLCVAQAAPPGPSEKFSDLEPAIQMLRDELGQDRRDIVASSMLITASEGKIFWPLYDEYRGEQRKLGDRKLALIKDFIANRSTMSEEHAEKLTKEALSIEEERTSIKEDYVKKMSKVLSARTVARFFQIDAKLDAVFDAALAARVPLIH